MEFRRSTPDDGDEDDGSAFINLPENPKAKEPPPQPFHVHPENWQAFEIFLDLRTQWRLLAGMSGVIHQGLDYPAALALIETEIVKPERRRETFKKIRLLEAAALSVINGKDVSNDAADSG